MKRAFLREHGKGSLELIEEASVLLRTCPASALAAYFIGSVPFAAGFLIFCADLSRNPDASEDLGAATLGMAALFLWMKFFHARFCGMLLARLRGEPPPAWIPREIFRSVCLQAILQSTALFILPISVAVVLPCGWVYAFYQNVSTLNDGKTRQKSLIQSAARQSLLWPGQNHLLLLVLSGFGLFVFVDWATLGFFAPRLLKMLFGIESAFTRSPMSIFNATFFAAVLVLTYLSVDPLLKACYTLRCFYGKSLQSGDDLKTELRRLAGRIPALAACLLICFATPALAASPTAPLANDAPTPAPAVTGDRLDRAIAAVEKQHKYTWRNPPPKKPETSDGLLDGFVQSIFRIIKKPLSALGDLLDKIARWFRLRDDTDPISLRGWHWSIPPAGILYPLLVVVVGALAFAVWRVVRSRRRDRVPEDAIVVGLPDVEDENTMADELPEDDWTKMGRRFLEQGDLRLALRSFYLASLAHLASSGLITIVRSKSNRDYVRELGRRGHTLPELPVLFGENVHIIDRIWYGMHEVSPELVQRFLGNVEKMKGVA